jgi:holin-like protein
MRILKQLGIILIIGYFGEILSYYIPLGLPASILGLLLMLAVLGLKLVKPGDLGETGDYLSANMAFFFLPAAATVLENYEHIASILVQVILICVSAAILTFFVTYGTVRFFRIILSKRG